MKKTIEIPEGYEAKIEGNKVILEPKESEDEKVRKEIIGFLDMINKDSLEARNFIADRYGDVIPDDMIPTWIAWLEKQGSQNLANSAKTCKDEQNPAWSEEDEHRYSDVIYFLETAKKHYASVSEIEASISWLKSLKERYTWKPSDEQMDALDNFIYAVNPDTKKYGKIIISLYDDLKKLKE